MSHHEVITRGDLPHWYMPGVAHFVTYRLADTLPANVLRRLRAERDARLNQPPAAGVAHWEHKAQAHKQYFAVYDRYLDQVSPIRWLENPSVAEIIVENLYHHHGAKYQLLEYTVMSNHVHVLFLPVIADAGSVGVQIPTQPTNQSDLEFHSDESEDTRSPLSKIMHSLKSYTANEANKVLERSGRFWQRESYDHWVRDEPELVRIAEYIANNAVSANLAANAWDWPYCSAHDRKKPRTKPFAQWW